MAKLRKLNKEEKEIAQTLIERGKIKKNLNLDNARVAFIHRGNFTIATVAFGETVASDVAKFNPFDTNIGIPFNEKVGERIALSRALHQLV